MGSVKDLGILKQATPTESGLGIFTFSDRYSVFDWGEMPDNIPGKGFSLCMMAAWNFERLEDMGIRTHYLGVLDNTLNPVKTTELTEPSNKMLVKLVRVIKPEFNNGNYDYSSLINGRGQSDNFVVPLEVIYRRGAPKGSSLFRTIAKYEAEGMHDELQLLLDCYGLTEKPVPGQLFPKTGYDFTTKFEKGDRKVNDKEAYEISGLTHEQFMQLQTMRNGVVEFVSGRAAEVGMVDYDGKHEYTYSGGTSLADAVGTFDENRFMLNDEQVSKEFLRQHYQVNQPEWVEDINRAKEEARNDGIQDWKTLVTSAPKHLDTKLVRLVGEMYVAGAQRYTALKAFGTVPFGQLEYIMDQIRSYYPK